MALTRITPNVTNGVPTGSQRNFIINGQALPASTYGYSLYVDTAGTSPINGAGTGTNTITFTTSSTSPLTGDNSFIFTKPASNAQGQGVAYNFSIDNASRSKSMQISFDLLVQSGTFAVGSPGIASDVTVWIYDVTNSVLIQPNQYSITQANSTVSSQVNCSFQTSSNSSSYRLILHVGTTSALAYTLQLDNISVSQLQAVTAAQAIITPWQSYNLVIGGSTTAPTPGTNTSSAKWRQVGDSMEIIYYFSQTSTGSAGSGTYLFPIPAGYTIDTNKITGTLANSNGNAAHIAGICSFGNTASSASSSVGTGIAVVYNSTNIAIFGDGGTPGQRSIISSTSFSIASLPNINYSFSVTVPIVGFAAGGFTGDGTVIAASYGGTPTGTVTNGSYSLVKFPTVNYDTNGAYSPTTGLYSAPTPGIYEVECSVFINSNSASNSGCGIAIYKNGSLYQVKIERLAGGTTNYNPNGVFSVQLNAGDTIAPYVFLEYTSGGTIQSGQNNYLNIKKVSGGVTIGASNQKKVLRLASSNGYGSTNTVIRRYLNIIETSLSGDVTYADSATLGMSVTVNTAGLYHVARRDMRSANLTCLGISVNSNQLTTSMGSGLTATTIIQQGFAVQGVQTDAGKSVYLNAGDIVRAHDNAGNDGSLNDAQCEFYMIKLN